MISSIRTNSDALQTKNDVATRLLLTSGNFSDRVHYQLATHVDPARPPEGTLITYPLAKDGLPWRERLRHWTRWVTPTGKKNILPRELQINPNKHPPTILLSAPAEPRAKIKPGRTKKAKAAEKGVESPYWSSDIFTETSVLFGSVLHSPLQPIPRPVSAEGLANDSVVHTFSSHVPNISRLLSKAHTKQDNLKGEHALQRLVVRFQPNPFYVPPTGKGELMRGPLGPTALSAFPQMEMIFDIGDDDAKSAKLKYIQAIVHEGKKDVMLPGSAVDLRFQQRTTSRLKRRYIDQVEDFLRRSNLNLAGNASLETPPSITLPISSNICREPGFKLLDGKDPKKGNEAEKDIRNVEYLYTGLEIRRTRAFNYKGWLLLYTSYEAGNAGGSRGELRLRPKKHGEVVQEEELVGFAYRLARDITNGGDDVAMFNAPLIQRIPAKDSRTLPPVRSPPMLVRQVTTKEPEEPWYSGNKYFAKRPLESVGDEDEIVGWEPSFKAYAEGEDTGKVEDRNEVEGGHEGKDDARKHGG